MIDVLGLPNLQGVYDAGDGVAPTVQMDSTRGAIILRDAAVSIGDLLKLQNNGGVDFFNVDESQMDFGPASRRSFRFKDYPNGKGGLTWLPDGGTFTGTASEAALNWSSTVTSNIPGGAPFGNDTAPAMVASTGECIFLSSPFLFATSLLFNQATTITLQGFNCGPIYTMVHQPLIRVGSVGGSRSMSQMNAVRAQPKIGPNVAGNLTATSIELFYAFCTVDSTVGTVSATDIKYFAAKDPNLVAGGTIGTLTCLDIPAMTGATNIYGINSGLVASANRRFIRHVGTAQSDFGGAIGLGSGATIDVLLSRGAANRLDIATGDSVRIVNGSLQFVGTGGQIASSVSGEIEITSTRLGFGTAPAGSNWAFGLNATARAISLAGNFANCLNMTGGSHTINAALSTFTQWTINAPSGAIGTGSVVNAANVIIQTNVAVGTNRYGLLVTSNPSGGTVNRCARFQGAAGVQIDGDLVFMGSIAGLLFGEIYAKNNATTMSVSSAGYTQVVIFNTDGLSNGMTPDHTNDHITCDFAAKYLCTLSMTVINGAGAGHTLDIDVFKNNGVTAFNNLHAHRTLGAGTDIGSVSISGIIELALNDTVEVWISTDRVAASTITVEDITLSLVHIGGS